MSIRPTVATTEPTAMPAITPGDKEELVAFCGEELLVLVVGAAVLFEVPAAPVDPAADVTEAALLEVAAACETVSPNVDTDESCPRFWKFVVYTVSVKGLGAQPTPDNDMVPGQ
jgi:hypothetical protein